MEEPKAEAEPMAEAEHVAISTNNVQKCMKIIANSHTKKHEGVKGYKKGRQVEAYTGLHGEETVQEEHKKSKRPKQKRQWQHSRRSFSWPELAAPKARVAE